MNCYITGFYWRDKDEYIVHIPVLGIGAGSDSYAISFNMLETNLLKKKFKIKIKDGGHFLILADSYTALEIFGSQNLQGLPDYEEKMSTFLQGIAICL